MRDLQEMAARADELAGRGDYSGAQELYLDALHHGQGDPGDVPVMCRCLVGLARTHQRTGAYAEAEACLRRVLERRDELGIVGFSWVATAETQLVVLLLIMKRYADAMGVCQSLITDWERRFGIHSAVLAEPLTWAARASEGMSNVDAAAAYLSRALSVAADDETRRSLRADACLRLGRLYEKQGAIGDAQRAYRRAIAEHTPAHTTKAAVAIHALARVCRQLREYDEAERWSDECLSILENAADVKELNIASAYNDLALVYLHTGKTAQAAALLSRAVDMSRHSGGTDLAISLHNLAEVRLDQAMREDAKKLLVEALRILEACDAPQVHLARSLYALGRIYVIEERLDLAESVLERAIRAAERAGAREELVDALEAYASVLRKLQRAEAAGEVERRARRERGGEGEDV